MPLYFNRIFSATLFLSAIVVLAVDRTHAADRLAPIAAPQQLPIAASLSSQAVPAPQNAQSVARSGGLVQHSFDYHRGMAAPTVSREPSLRQTGAQSGWYHYGFPIQSYRWGYFGAERHYPRVIWHTTWYGDCTRTAYW